MLVAACRILLKAIHDMHRILVHEESNVLHLVTFRLTIVQKENLLSNLILVVYFHNFFFFVLTFFNILKEVGQLSEGKDSASESRTKLASVMPSAACLRDFNRKIRK